MRYFASPGWIAAASNPLRLADHVDPLPTEHCMDLKSTWILLADDDVFSKTTRWIMF